MRAKANLRRRPMSTAAATLAVAFLAGLAPSPASAADKAGARDLAAAELHLTNEQPAEAIEILDRRIKKAAKDAEARVLRSTARFMTGDLDGGRLDLERALELAPDHRQAWLNLAALELAQERYPEALAAFERTESLDPDAAENSLNIGAVLLLMNRFKEAEERFKTYLARHPRDPEARYLVATNYAMRGFADPAVANLKRSIGLDEKMRRRARTDPNFAPLERSAPYQDLLNTDSYRHPPGSLFARKTYETPYLAGQSPVLDAVISSLQIAGTPFDPRVEVAASWALIWSDLRIKVRDAERGTTEVVLSAPPGRYAPATWDRVTTELFRSVTVQLHMRQRKPAGSNR